ncbi:MAG: hypothetical protein HY040_29055 [Planctomycetes bacterium]|nr:hypothetical protein [Planctomycetota bacterium]
MIRTLRSGKQPCLPSCEPSTQDGLPLRGMLIVLALFLLFAHGCHGDEDTELFNLIKKQAAETTSAAR